MVVIQQGNNYIAGEGSFASQIDEAMTVLSGVERVVWLDGGGEVAVTGGDQRRHPRRAAALAPGRGRRLGIDASRPTPSTPTTCCT